ncbi:ABC transporter permease [Chakrabartyella piscis]|uniref:ABC transporter permease n=1 Tax=Chakrabartyella piscis TaxID=2918914 RepID=UPI00295842A7|nr:ABC transporter permease [Chakrabartyella piscis]
MQEYGVFTLFLFSIVVYNTVLLYGTVGEILTEKAGSLNLGVEGTMAVGAIFGYLAGVSTNNLWIGLVGAFIAGGLCGLLFAFLTVSLQANQNVTGLTITTFGLGLYFFVGKGFGSNWPALQSAPDVVAAYAAVPIPVLSSLPMVGKAFFSHSVLVYLGVLIAVGIWWYMKYTKTGLKLRAVGENPSAADSVGININLYKYIHIIIGSGIMGLGGYYMALVMGGSFEGSTCWINGYGWISIALVIFANWNPVMAILGSLVFGFFNTLQVYSGSLANSFPESLGWLSGIPAQLYQALPFLITAIVLIASSIRQKDGEGGPAALGVNYFREER